MAESSRVLLICLARVAGWIPAAIRSPTAAVPLVLLCPALLLSSCAGEAKDDGAPASIIIVTIDTLRADHLGAYDYFRDTSPVLDGFAEESLVFSNAVTTMATTLPAHTSLFTSRYPVQTGVTKNGFRVRLNGERVRDLRVGSRTRLFAEILSSLGYTTAAFVSAVPVKASTGLNSGFQLFDEPGHGSRTAEATTSRVLEWLRDKPSEPFFLWVHYFDPHDPYEPPEEFRIFETDERLIEFLSDRGVAKPIDPALLSYNNLYDGEILATDAQVGRLLDELKARQLLNRSALVVTADHGEALGEHEKVGHGGVNNDELFVPMMIRFPTGNTWNGRRFDRLVSLVDVLPMLVDELGIPVDPRERERFAGINPLDRSVTRRYALVQRSTFNKRELLGRGRRERYSLVGLDWKYVLYPQDGSASSLFDMRHDRAELNDLASVKVDTAADMKQQLLAQIALYSGEDDFQVVEETLPAVLEELRALGYLD